MKKRIFDFVAASVGILVLSPLLLTIAIIIALDSRGPVFFRQTRVGIGERLFNIHKFRTMVANAESLGGQLTVSSDKRVTKIGAILRRYKLDELPQLFDVFRGEMSLVGPRPEVPKYVSYYPPESRKIIYSVRPGITDLASIEYKEESTLLNSTDDYEFIYINKIIPEKIKYYEKYVNNNSLFLDFQIILKTIAAIFKHD